LRITGYRPSNAFLERQLDARWTRWLTWCAAGGLLTAAALGSFIAPHQAVIRMRYEIAQLSTEVDRLDRERRALLLDRERLTSLPLLAEQAASLGLAAVPHERTVFLAADGTLAVAGVAPKQATPTEGRP
jgi:hypothetical protein